jgi:hypothetical protein
MQKINYLDELIREKGTNIPLLSKTSGCPYSHIDHILKNKIKTVKRDKLLQLAMGLNLTYKEMNDLLINYDYQMLKIEDCNTLIDFALNMNITGSRALYEDVNVNLLLIATENLSIDVISINYDVPSSTFSPHGFYSYLLKKMNISDPVYSELMEKFILKRKEILNRNLEKYNYHHVFCKKTLEAFIRGDDIQNEGKTNEKNEELEYRIKHLNIYLEYAVKYPKTYKFSLIEEIPTFPFDLFIADQDIDNNKLFDWGHIIPVYYKHFDLSNIRLMGYVTNDKELFRSSFNEYKRLLNSKINDLDSVDKLKDYFDSISKRGLNNEVQHLEK